MCGEINKIEFVIYQYFICIISGDCREEIVENKKNEDGFMGKLENRE
jgi:hypothetical protein